MIATYITALEREKTVRWNTLVPDTLPQSQTQTFISFDTKKGENVKKETNRKANSIFSWRRVSAVLT